MLPLPESQLPIHSLQVIYGDVRAENILIGKDNKSVWIVDFEFSEILTEATDLNTQSRIFKRTKVLRIYYQKLNVSPRQIITGGKGYGYVFKGRV